MTLGTSNITTTQVANALQVSTRNIGELCTSQKINEDSLFKPYEVNSNVNSQFLIGGPNGTYGYTIYNTDLYSLLDFRNYMWEHNPPTTCYRLGDFRGYNSTVKYESTPWGCKLISGGKGEDIKLSFTHGKADGLLSPYNMEIFKNYYPAVQVWSGTSDMTASLKLRWAQCCDSTYGSTPGQTMTILNSDINITDEVIIIVPFISQYKFTKGSGNNQVGNGKKYCMNYKENQTIRISDLPPTLYAIYTQSVTKNSANSVNVDITLHKYVTQSLSLNATYIQIKLWDGTNGSGNVVFSNFGKYDNTTYRYPQIEFTETNQALPRAIVSWDPKYNSTSVSWNAAKSITVQIDDPYNGYTYTVNTINL